MKFNELAKGKEYVVGDGLDSMVNCVCQRVKVDGAFDGLLIEGNVYTQKYYNFNEFEFRVKL